MQWKIDLLRGVDPDVLMTAHGIGNSINWVFSHGSDHWQAASHVQSYGLPLCSRGKAMIRLPSGILLTW